jgi:hypothetical protein
MDRSESTVLIENVKNLDSVKKDVAAWILEREKDIKNYRLEVRKGNTKNKALLEKYEKFFKVDRTCAAPIAWRLLNYFVEEAKVSIATYTRKMR